MKTFEIISLWSNVVTRELVIWLREADGKTVMVRLPERIAKHVF
jgi:hypothetical protein